MTEEKSFLERLAGRYLEALSEQMAPEIMVFPNRRAMNVFRRTLVNIQPGALLLPSLETIESYSARVSGYTQLSKREMLAPLFSIRQQTHPEESFEQFMNWAPTLIDDFNDIDDYLADGEALFEYLSEARAIEMWNPSGQALSDFQKRFMHFWQSLPELYHAVKQLNREQKMGTAGQVKRQAAEVLGSKKEWLHKHTWFSGFNALTPSEAALIEVLSGVQSVKVFWDADRYYYADFEHEAGKYIRFYHQRWEKQGISEILLHQGWGNPKKKISFTGAPGLSGQALAATEALLKIRDDNPDLNIAVVATGMQAEQALSYLLPEGIELNFSPGIPFSATPAAGFIHLSWELWLRHHPAKGFPASELGALLQNPLAAEMGGRETSGILDMLRESGKPWIGKGEFPENSELDFIQWLSSFMYGNYEDCTQWAQRMRNLLFTYFNENYNNKPYDKRSIGLGLAITAIDHFLKEAGGLPPETLDPFHGKRWMQQSVRELKVPVEGNPTAGVQVMGLLESRNLDFDVVILVGANEGQLPAPAQPSTFIPLDIRQQFRLPGRSDRESVFAYHFYRMLQHPAEVVLIYNTEVDEFGSGEKSRYLQQLEFEWPRKVKGAEIRHEVRKSAATQTPERKVTGQKNEQALKAIEARLQKGLSPTALNSLRACSLQFYLQYILGLQEAAEQSSVLGPDTLGSALHYAFESIYKAHEGKVLKPEFLNAAKKDIKNLVEAGIHHAFEHADLSGGKNYLLKEMSETLVRKIIDFDLGRIKDGKEISIIQVEEELQAILDIAGHQVLFKGFADRIEMFEGKVVVVDYKTGKTDANELVLTTVEDFKTQHSDKAFQLMMYRWMYEKKSGKSGTEAGILSVRRPTDGIMKLLIADQDQLMPRFEQYLKDLITDLLNPEKGFEQTDDEELCTYCSFARLCGRTA